MGKRKYRRPNRTSGATAFVIKVGILCCFLLLVNAAMIHVACMFVNNVSPSLFSDQRILQAIMYFGPIALICFEFWIYDRRTDYVARKSQSKKTGRVDATVSNASHSSS